MAHTHTLFR